MLVICLELIYMKAVVYSGTIGVVCSGSNGQLKPISSKLQNSAE